MRAGGLLVVSLVVLLSSFVAACSGDSGAKVEIRIVSDLVPRLEVGRASAVLFAAGTSTTSLGSIERVLAEGAPLARGLWVASFENVPHGTYTVWTRLSRDSGEVLGERPVTFTLTDDASFTVTITADCVDVECPGGGNAAFIACVAGTCVDPRCTFETPEFCPPGAALFCGDESDCEAAHACGAPRCESGACLQVPIDDACGEGEFCSALTGCTPRPIEDGGVPRDGGDADAALDAAQDAGTEADAGAPLDAETFVDMMSDLGMHEGMDAASLPDMPEGMDAASLPDMPEGLDAGTLPDALVLPDVRTPCSEGYTGFVEEGCVDADECVTDNGGCGSPAFYACLNEPGSFRCEPRWTLARLTEGAAVGPAPVLPSGQSARPVFSPDGAKVAFLSCDPNLVEGDRNGRCDIFVVDVATNEIELVSVREDDSQLAGDSWDPRFSPNGTKILFQGRLTVGGYGYQILLKDLASGELTVVSTTESGEEANGGCGGGRFSADGTKLVFRSSASNLVLDDVNGRDDLFVKDLVTGAVTRVSTTSEGLDADDVTDYGEASFSPDGTKVLFNSRATNFVDGDANGKMDVFVKDLATGLVTRVSVAEDGAEGDDDSYFASFLPDGNVVFVSLATTLVDDDTNGASDVFIKDLSTGEVTRVSVNEAGDEGNGVSEEFSSQSPGPASSADGRHILFRSSASNLVSGDTNGTPDLFLKDLDTGAVTRVSVDASGAQVSNFYGGSDYALSPDAESVVFSDNGTFVPQASLAAVLVLKDLSSGAVTKISEPRVTVEHEGNYNSIGGVISGSGRRVVFTSSATNLVPGDTNDQQDVFVRDLDTGVISLASLAADGAQADGPSSDADISPVDDDAIVFVSSATNLDGWPGGYPQIYVKDLGTGAVTRISEDADGNPIHAFMYIPTFSPDGNRVAFTASGTVYVKDLLTDELFVASSSADGTPTSQSAYFDALPFSLDGTRLAFASSAPELVPGGTNGQQHVFVKNLVDGSIVLASITAEGVEGNSSSFGPAFMPDGDLVFASSATNLASGLFGYNHVYRRHRTTGALTVLSVREDGTALYPSAQLSHPRISADGRRLVVGADNGLGIFVVDLPSGGWARLVTRAGAVASISSDGRRIAFYSDDPLVPGDTNGMHDVFLVELDE